MQIEKELSAWSYLQEIPREIDGFVFHLDMNIQEDIYDIYSYVNETLHKCATAYYHEETHEYKLRVGIGLTEFCCIEYIAPDLACFEKLIKQQFPGLLKDMSVFNPRTVSCLVREKEILTWHYQDVLPDELEGFSLYIKPDEPVRIINGSYIILDYSDFAIKSNFIIYYNVFRDEFFGEARINNIPEVNYLFDAADLSGLMEKLSVNLIPRLHDIRDRAEDILDIKR